MSRMPETEVHTTLRCTWEKKIIVVSKSLTILTSIHILKPLYLNDNLTHQALMNKSQQYNREEMCGATFQQLCLQACIELMQLLQAWQYYNHTATYIAQEVTP